MGKLKTLSSGLSVMPSRLTFARDEHGHSTKAEPWRGWYNLAEWKRLRIATFKRDGFTCQCGCGVTQGRTALLVADHKIPHRGDRDKFFDPDNVWTLRKSPCHDKLKQAEERRAPWQA